MQAIVLHIVGQPICQARHHGLMFIQEPGPLVCCSACDDYGFMRCKLSCIELMIQLAAITTPKPDNPYSLLRRRRKNTCFAP